MYSHQLETFLAVCKSGSFTRAAKDGYITSSAVVQQINLLEKRLGVKLFLRTNHGISLTPAGSVLEKEAEEFIRHAEYITDKMARASGHGPIRLGWTTGAEDTRFLSECLKFRDANEGVEINLTHIAPDILTALKANTIDLCQFFEVSLIEEYGYAFTPLYEVRQCIVFPDRPEAGMGDNVRLEDLAGREIVVLKDGILPDHDAFKKLVRASGIPVTLTEVGNYDFETQALLYSRSLPFLGCEALSRQYAPLVSIPASWDIGVRVGLISRLPGWTDLDMLVSEIRRSY